MHRFAGPFFSPSKHRRVGFISPECICPNAARLRAEGICMLTPKNWARYVTGSVAIIGVLAFLFAVASADDDLNQQEFLHSRRSTQVLLWRSNVIRLCCFGKALSSPTSGPAASISYLRLSRALTCNISIIAFETFPISPTGQRPPPSSQV
jgi:hypothetical protein